MSVNRENVIWQSRSGLWRRGFYTMFEGDTSDPDYDFEWDVEYDEGSFEWVSRPCATSEAADRSWTGANPGGSSVVPFSDVNASVCDEFDAMAARLTGGR